MKKNFILSVCLLMAAFTLFSCQDEENQTTISEDEALSKSAPLTGLLQRIAMVDVSSDNIIDSTSCFKVQLPVNVIVNGQPVHIDSEEDFATVQQILDTTDPVEVSVDLVFPITVIFADGQEQTIQNQEIFDAIVSDCEFGYPNEEPINCISINYPVTIFGYNANFQLASTHVIQNNQQLFALLFNLQANQFYSIDFPISITNVDGEIITITTNSELQAAITENICAPVDPCFNPQILTNGLIVYMPFANEAKDLVSGTTAENQPNYPPVFVSDRNGNQNSAVSFSGNAYGYLKINTTQYNNIEVGDSITVSLWFRTQELAVESNLQQLFGKSEEMGNTNQPGFGLYIAAGLNNLPQFISDNSAISDSDWTPALGSDNTSWHHFVLTIGDGYDLKLYRDGVLVNDTVLIENIFLNTQAFDYYLGRYFAGYIDDLRVYRRTLTAEEVQVLYNLEGDQNTCLSN